MLSIGVAELVVLLGVMVVVPLIVGAVIWLLVRGTRQVAVPVGFCSHCGQPRAVGAQFCGICGQPLY